MLIKKDGIYRNIDATEFGIWQQMGFEKVVNETVKIEEPKVIEPEPIVEEQVAVEEPIVEESIVEEEPIVAPKPKKKK